jgi:hypothetical protein
MQSFENYSETIEAAPSQRLERGNGVALNGKQEIIESKSAKQAKAIQLQEIADAHTAKKGPNKLIPKGTALIQREIIGTDGGNIWAKEIGPKLITEPNQVIVIAVRELHDEDEKIPVSDYDTLRQGILDGDYNQYLSPATIEALNRVDDVAEVDDEDDVADDDAGTGSAVAVAASAAAPAPQPKPKSKGKPLKKSARAKKDEKRRAKGKAKPIAQPVKIGDDSWVSVDVGNSKVAGLKNLTNERENALLKSAPSKLDDEAESELLLRGDTRSPNDLSDSDGFKSYLRSEAIQALKDINEDVDEDSIQEMEVQLIKLKQGHESPMEHMVPAGNGAASSFMSFTRAVEPSIAAVAEAGQHAARGATQGYIYAVLADEATPIKGDELVQAAMKYEALDGDEEAQKKLLKDNPELNAYIKRENFESYNQAEYLVRNQVDWAHVVAYQEVRDGVPYGPVFMRSTLEEDPTARAKISSVFQSTPKKLEKDK